MFLNSSSDILSLSPSVYFTCQCLSTILNMFLLTIPPSKHCLPNFFLTLVPIGYLSDMRSHNKTSSLLEELVELLSDIIRRRHRGLDKQNSSSLLLLLITPHPRLIVTTPCLTRTTRPRLPRAIRPRSPRATRPRPRLPRAHRPRPRLPRASSPRLPRAARHPPPLRR